MFLHRLAVAFFLIMVSIGLMLPSDGNHGLFSPKSLAFLSATTFAGLSCLTLPYYPVRLFWLVSRSTISYSLLILWLVLGIHYSNDGSTTAAFDQFKIFAITFMAVAMTAFYLESGLLRSQRLIEVALYANAGYSFIKLIAAFFHISGIMNILTFMQKTGFRLMSMDIHGGMIRLQTSVDIVTPFLLLFALQRDSLGLKLSQRWSFFYFPLSLISVLLSFSRYLIFVAALAFFFHWITLSAVRKIRGIFIAILFSSIVVSAIGWENVYKVIEKRLYSLDNYHSDRTRSQQITALESEVIAYPLCGKGLGASAPDCIRDHALPYSYEVQWIGFAMQLGLIGLLFFTVALLSVGWRYLTPPHTLSKCAFFCLYLLWLLSGFTNPFLISLTSGIIYALFSAAGLCLTQHPYEEIVSYGKINRRNPSL